jgi:hypothetical protein
MKLNSIILCVALLLCTSASVMAQNQYSLSACGSSSKSGKLLGGRFKLKLPKGAIVKKGRDVDYSNYAIGIGPKKGRVRLAGIYGPLATSGKVPADWLSASAEVSQRTWKFADLDGVDAKGKLKNGNYWRYFGIFGESIEYYDVSEEAATYFDGIINNVCFLDWR